MVGIKVCFIDGVPFKDGYRRYKIKHGQGNNDYLSIQEVVSAATARPGRNNELYPDVILIDGGLGQLHAAMEVFKTMDVKPPMVISLAKKEELVYVQAKTRADAAAAEQPGPEAAAVHPRRGPPLRAALPPHPAAQDQLEEDVKGPAPAAEAERAKPTGVQATHITPPDPQQSAATACGPPSKPSP